MYRADGQSDLGGERAHGPAALIFRLLTHSRLHFVPGVGIMLGRSPGAGRIAQALQTMDGKRPAHFPTVIGGIFSAAAIRWLFDPSAAAKTMRLRCANDWRVEEEWTNLSKVLRSDLDENFLSEEGIDR